MSALNENKRADLTFVSQATADQFNCAICRNTMVNPTDIGCTNQHLFCLNCIKQIPVYRLLATYNCPICREICNIANQRRMPFIERQIQSLQVKCKNHQISAEMANLMSKKHKNQHNETRKRRKKKSNKAHHERARSRSRSREILSTTNRNNDDNDNEPQQYVCDWIGSLADYENGRHICDLDIVECKHCKKTVIRQILHEYHTIIKCSKCRQSFVKCQQHLCPMDIIKCKCGLQMERGQIEGHQKYICPEQIISCSYSTYGCREMLKRKKMTHHEKEAKDYHLGLVKSKCQSLKRQIAHKDIKISLLEIQLLMKNWKKH